jgi:DNA-binding MarR family transcriptional regulator
MARDDDQEQDSDDQHVARWSAFWKNEPAFAPEVEGALVRMNFIQREARRADAVAFAESRELTAEDYKTLHVLMIQPWPIEATPAQLAEASKVTRAAMTSRLDRLVAAELVTRENDETDRRRVLIRPTAAGRAMWSKYIFEGMARDQRLLRALSHEELIQLNGLLRKVLLDLES